ncbi:MAG TPA: hypothetical protein VFH40_16740 [Gemmatimonadales bacterium]|nr:hypothetical protein [Gemmatimonadales bacterium]
MNQEPGPLGSAGEPTPAFATAPDPTRSERPGRVHWVVVITRAPKSEDRAPTGITLVTRFWHPRDRSWSENAFESLDHAIRMFVDESGWVLRQHQSLDAPQAHELLFEARREDFSRPSTEQMLQEVGLTPEDVADLLTRVKREGEGAA